MPIVTVTFVQATYVMATFVHISNISRQGQGKVNARSRQGHGKVKARSRQEQGKAMVKPPREFHSEDADKMAEWSEKESVHSNH